MPAEAPSDSSRRGAEKIEDGAVYELIVGRITSCAQHHAGKGFRL